MRRITISSSLKFKKQIKLAISNLKEIEVEALFPNLEDDVAKEDITIHLMKQLTKEHFEAIDGSEALYVICPSGYVGTLVSIEIGYAHARGKPIIFSEKPEDLGLQVIAGGYISLGELEKFKTLN